MIAAAEEKAVATNSRYVTFEDGIFQVYLTPVEQRTRAMQAHSRVSYYILRDGQYRRTSKEIFLKEMECPNSTKVS
jgi:hypothetical protein